MSLIIQDGKVFNRLSNSLDRADILISQDRIAEKGVTNIRTPTIRRHLVRLFKRRYYAEKGFGVLNIILGK
jgi:hypothetical protein